MMVSGPANSRTLREKVYMILKERIMTRKLRVGDPLKEEAIARELKVSRTPVREAIQQLQNDALIEMIPNRGAYVTFISLKDLKNILQLRQILEGAAARLAVGQIDPIKLGELEKEFLYLRKQGNRVTYEKQQSVGIQLHDLILQAAGNEKIVHLTQSIREQVRALCLSSIKSPGRVAEAIREHLNIISALKKNDGASAEKYMVTHLESVYRNIVEHIR